MSGTLTKTRAEKAFVDDFSKISATLPGGPFVLAERELALARFAEQGLPHRRIEEWKYTDLRNSISDPLPLINGNTTRKISSGDLKRALGPLGDIDSYLFVFVDGVYCSDLSNYSGAKGFSFLSFAQLLTTGERDDFDLSLAADADAIRALNTAYATDGYVIKVAHGATFDKPIMVVHLDASEKAGWTATRNSVRVGKDADATLLEVFVSLDGTASMGQTNTMCDVEVGGSAKFKHVKCVLEDGQKVHLSNWIVKIREDADYSGFLFVKGTSLARNDVLAKFIGEDAKLNLSGAFLARGSEHIDNTMVIDHQVPGCESRELFKGVLEDQARGVVQGKVIVQRDAQKTDGKQMAQALMLSPETEFDSKPELEIYADDVICGHGSTVAEIDKDLLFYCLSRGIPLPKARELLVQSFVGEALEAVENESIEQALQSIVSAWVGSHGG